MKMKVMILAMLLTGSLSIGVRANTLAEWSASGLTGGFVDNPVWSNATASVGMDSSATVVKLDETKTNSSYKANSGVMTYTPQNDTSLNTNKYIQIFVTPEAGQTMSLSSLSFNLWVGDTASTNAAVRSSLDNFSTDLATITLTAHSHNRPVVELSTRSDFHSIASPVEFRIYLWNGTGLQVAYFSDGTGSNAVKVEGVVAPGVVSDPLAAWSTDGLTGGFAANPVWSNATVAAGIDSDAAIAKLDETKTNSSSYYGSTSVMTYQLQNNTSMDTNRYIQVFVAPEAGQAMTLHSFSFDVRSTASGAQNSAVRSSLDGFASDLGAAALVRGKNSRPFVDLRTAGFNNLTSPVEFRIYLWNAAGYQTAYLVDSASNSIEIEGTLSSGGYEAWASGWGVALGSETDDYDHDGLPNVYEYGLGGDPTNAADQGISPTFLVDGASLSYIYPQRSDPASGLDYHLETRDDLVLGSWINAGYTVTGTNIVAGNFNYVTNEVSTATKAKQFIKLVIDTL